MAAAEARAAWQRSANRCFVQEDAKRAPKLACCSSSSSATQYDSGSGDTTNEPDHSVNSFMPVNWNQMDNNLPLEAKWWLQSQPNFNHHKDYAYEQLKGLKDEYERNETDGSLPSSKLSDESALDRNLKLDVKKCDDFSFESSWMVTTFMQQNFGEETKIVSGKLQEPLKHKVEMGEISCRDELVDCRKSFDPLISPKPEKSFTDMEPSWATDDKSTPWWRITDKEELALLVAHKSSQHIENCDLPRPSQYVHVGIDPYAGFESLGSEGIFSMSSGQKSSSGICTLVDVVHQSYTSESCSAKYSSSSEVSHPYNSKMQQSTTDKFPSEGKEALESDSTRAQLLEALCHSQTRAREAEIAAQKAYNEKEHILKLLFKQASQLFAYKQWVHILQLEALYLQLKIKENQMSELLPGLPWMPLKGNPIGKERGKGNKPNRCNLCKSVVFFAVGFGLAGAGLFLGWTLGWLFPCF